MSSEILSFFVDVRAQDAAADLAGAAVASVAVPLLLSERFSPASALGRNFIVYGGMFVIAKSISDIIEPRVMAMMPKAQQLWQVRIERALVPFAVGAGLDMLAGTPLQIAAMTGLGTAIGANAGDMVFEALSRGAIGLPFKKMSRGTAPAQNPFVPYQAPAKKPPKKK